MLRLRPRHFWSIAILEGAFVSVTSSPLVPSDIWWTLNLGRLMAETGRLVSDDPFSFAPHEPEKMNTQWLAQLLYYAVYSVGDLEGVILLNAVLVTSALGLSLAAAWNRSGNPRLAAFLLGVGFILAYRNLGARAQLLAYPLFTSSLFVLYAHRRKAWLLWALPLIQVVWANSHGSFFLQPALIGAFFLGSVADALATKQREQQLASVRLAAAGAASVLAGLANPYGIGVFSYVLRIGTNPIIRDFVTEWAPTTINSDYGAMFFAALAFAGVCLYLSRLRLGVTDILLFLTLTYFGLASIRGIVWWALALPPLLAPYVASLPWPNALRHTRPGAAPRPVLNAVILAMVFMASLASLPWLKPANPLLPPEKRSLFGPETPVQVAEYLKSQPSRDRMFNYDGWGGYLGWQLWPRQIFVDGRIEIIPPEVWLDYLKLNLGVSHWKELTEKYRFGQFVLRRDRQEGLIEALSRDSGWQLVYEDHQAMVFDKATADRQ